MSKVRREEQLSKAAARRRESRAPAQAERRKQRDLDCYRVDSVLRMLDHARVMLKPLAARPSAQRLAAVEPRVIDPRTKKLLPVPRAPITWRRSAPTPAALAKMLLEQWAYIGLRARTEALGAVTSAIVAPKRLASDPLDMKVLEALDGFHTPPRALELRRAARRRVARSGMSRFDDIFWARLNTSL